MQEYRERLYATNSGNPEETDKVSEIYNLPRPNREKLENLSRPVPGKEIKTGINNLLKNKSPEPVGFTGQV